MHFFVISFGGGKITLQKLPIIVISLFFSTVIRTTLVFERVQYDGSIIYI